jgi:hypothetical protein
MPPRFERKLTTSVVRQSASLAGRALDSKGVLAPLGLPMLASRDAGAGGGDDLLQHRADGLLVTPAGVGEPVPQLPGDDAPDDPGRRRGAEDL